MGNIITMGGGRVPLVTTYHPALNNLGKVAGRLHSMITVWNVKSVVYSMWVALAHHLGLGLITSMRAIVSLSGAL